MVKKSELTVKDQKAILFTLENESGMRAEITNYGATIMKLYVPDKFKKVINVVLGYDTLDEYERGNCYFGAIVGRVANRIAGASFELKGKKYSLTANDNQNTLHGGRDFYHTRLWDIEKVEENAVTFKLYSMDMDQGFPGNLSILITYELNEENELKIYYHAQSDADTLVNLTNHSYFNLNGHNSGSVLNQEVLIHANGFTAINEKLIPTGEIVPVEGTPMDFRKYKKVGKEIEKSYNMLKIAGGYDHNMVLNGKGFREVAKMRSNESGITMKVLTDLPGMQFYTANFVNNEKGAMGTVYNKRGAVCFETQYFPDAIHHPGFAGIVIKAGEEYETITTYKFVIEKE